MKKQRKPSRPNARDRLRHREFARHYLDVGTRTYFNAERSAKAAGYNDSTCRHGAYRLLSQVGVQEEMRRLRDERLKLSTVCSPVEILEILSAQARTTPEVFVDENGAIIPLKAGEKDRAVAVASIKEKTRTFTSGDTVITERTVEYKLVDRTKALEILAKHHGLFEKDNEQQRPEAPVQLVAMPSGDLTLAEWTKQAQEVLNSRKTEIPVQKATS